MIRKMRTFLIKENWLLRSGRWLWSSSGGSVAVGCGEVEVVVKGWRGEVNGDSVVARIPIGQVMVTTLTEED